MSNQDMERIIEYLNTCHICVNADNQTFDCMEDVIDMNRCHVCQVAFLERLNKIGFVLTDVD